MVWVRLVTASATQMVIVSPAPVEVVVLASVLASEELDSLDVLSLELLLSLEVLSLELLELPQAVNMETVIAPASSTANNFFFIFFTPLQKILHKFRVSDIHNL